MYLLNLFRPIEAGLIVVLAIVAADLCWSLLAPVNSYPDPENFPVEWIDRHPDNAHGGNRNAVDVLFGVVTRINTSSVAQHIEETGLNMQLKGVLTHQLDGRNLALIAIENGREEVYSAGDRVQGAEIIRVETRRVILSRNGVNESLSLNYLKLDPHIPGGRAVQEHSEPVSVGGGSVAEQYRVVNKDLLLEGEIPDVFRHLNLTPHIDHGIQNGFRITGLDQEGVLNQLGLEQADVIRAVNGTSISNTAEAIKAYRELKTAGNFRVDLIRNGREVSIDYTVR